MRAIRQANTARVPRRTATTTHLLPVLAALGVPAVAELWPTRIHRIAAPARKRELVHVE